MKSIKLTSRVGLIILFMATFLFSANVVLAQTNIITSKKGVRTYQVKNGQKDFKIEYEGEITLSNDDKDIVGITKGGFIEIKKSSFGTKRRILIYNETGTLVKKYFVGWSEKPYNPEGEKWLSEILPEILRTTTIAAKSRLERFYKKGGAKEVLAEVKEMKSDYVKSAYIRLLLEKNLNVNDLVRTIEFTGDHVKSDYYVSQILKTNQKVFLKNERTTTAYINATKSIESDYYATNILKKVLEDNNITDAQMGSMLEITKGIKSDYYITELLKNLMTNRKLTNENMNRILDLTNGMKSDYYKTSILKGAINKENLKPKTYNKFMTILDGVKSDYYVTNIIKELANKELDNESLENLLTLIDKKLKSDHYISNLYVSLADRSNLTENQLITIINSSANKIRSSHSLSRVLVAYSKQVKASSAKVKEAYNRAAKTIKSDTYYGRVMKAIN